MKIIDYIKSYADDQQKVRLEELFDAKENRVANPVLIGVSGTIAKTSVTELIAQYLMFLGKRVMIVGTSGLRVNDRVFYYSYPSTSAPNKTSMVEMFLIGLEQGVEYIVLETTAESTTVGVYDNLDFEVLTITNLTKEIVRSYPDQVTYFNEKIKLYKNNNIEYLVINRQCSPFCGFLDQEHHIKQLSVYDRGDVQILLDKQGKLSIKGFDELYSFDTNLLSSINTDNVLALLRTTQCLGLFIYPALRKFLSTVLIPGRLEHYTILDREIIIDSGYGGVEAVVPYFTESQWKNTYIVLSSYYFGNDNDKKDIIKAFRQNKASVFAQYGHIILTLTGATRTENKENIVINQMKNAVSDIFAIEKDRFKAIKKAWDSSNPGDRIFITGMGSELYKPFKDEDKQCNDALAVQNIINEYVQEQNTNKEESGDLKEEKE